MADLTLDAVSAIEDRVVGIKKSGKVPEGYPLMEMSTLLEAIRVERVLRTKYQRLAGIRGKVVMDIFSAASRAIDEAESAC